VDDQNANCVINDGDWLNISNRMEIEIVVETRVPRIGCGKIKYCVAIRGRANDGLGADKPGYCRATYGME
jgi:hypothetical protein